MAGGELQGTIKEPGQPRRRSFSGMGCLIVVCLLALSVWIGGYLFTRWLAKPGNVARSAGLTLPWIDPDQEIVDKDDPRGVVLRNRTNGDITIVGGRIEDIPPWIPIYPGAKIKDHKSTTRLARLAANDSFIDGQIELSTQDSRDRIFAYYKKESVRLGFEIGPESKRLLMASTPEEYFKDLQVSVSSRNHEIHLQYTQMFPFNSRPDYVPRRQKDERPAAPH